MGLGGGDRAVAWNYWLTLESYPSDPADPELIQATFSGVWGENVSNMRFCWKEADVAGDACWSNNVKLTNGDGDWVGPSYNVSYQVDSSLWVGHTYYHQWTMDIDWMDEEDVDPIYCGVEYTFKLTGCMASMAGTCSEATTRVRLRDEKLVTVIDGGDRTITAAGEAVIDGCTFTEDPDDEDAMISYSWGCETAAGPCDLPPEVPTDACSILLPPNSLTVGETHQFTLTASSENGEMETDSVRVSVEEGVVPECSVAVVGEQLRLQFKPRTSAA